MLTRHVERSSPFSWHASESLQLDRFRRTAVGALPPTSSFAGALKPTSLQRTHHRSSPPCLHVGKFNRTSRSPPALHHIKPKDTRFENPSSLSSKVVTPPWIYFFHRSDPNPFPSSRSLHQIPGAHLERKRFSPTHRTIEPKKRKRGIETLITPPPPSTRLDDAEARTGRSPLTEGSHTGDTNRMPTAKRMRRREQKPSVHREEDATPVSDGKTVCERLDCFLEPRPDRWWLRKPTPSTGINGRRSFRSFFLNLPLRFCCKGADFSFFSSFFLFSFCRLRVFYIYTKLC
ncbi:Uncharacterized protein Rs2_40722 [Raphanus sativus]|nr:Uncharacterized protein Rs2_40722 [Raphanus sativus]